MELTDVIQIETMNHRHIYLYNRKGGGAWNCYGRSALLLHRIYPNICCNERDISGEGDLLPVMIIDPMTLTHLKANLPPTYQDKEKIVIEIPETWTHLYL